MEISQLEQKVERKPMGLILGDAGLAVGCISGIGYSLLLNDAETGDYITGCIVNFIDTGHLAVSGFTTLGYSIGRTIDQYKK